MLLLIAKLLLMPEALVLQNSVNWSVEDTSGSSGGEN